MRKRRGRPHNFIDLTGQVFNMLTVIRHDKGSKWLCLCECGKEKVINGGSLRKNLTRSCGCMTKKWIGDRTRHHGKSKERVYRCWRLMLYRCYNKKSNRFHIYGGRGITVFQPWRESFVSFYAYMGEPPSASHTLDRINTDGAYEPGNVRWATQQEQQNNKRSNIFYLYEGQKLTITALAKKFNLPRSTIVHRVSLNWDNNDISLPRYSRRCFDKLERVRDRDSYKELRKEA